MRISRPLVIAGLLLGAVFLLFAGRALESGAMLELVRAAHRGYFAAALVCSLAFLMLKAVRWRYLLSPLAPVSTQTLLYAVFAGGAANVLIPHSGELIRAAVLHREHELPMSAPLGSIVVERTFDLVAVLALAVGVFGASPTVSQDFLSAGYALAAVSSALAAGAALFVVRTELCLAAAAWFMRPLRAVWRTAILHRLREAARGFASIRAPRLLLTILVLSLLQWWMLALCVGFSMAAVGDSVPHTAAVAVLVLCVAGLTLPSAPGYVGTTQLAFTAGLQAFQVSAEHAFAGSLLYNFLVAVPVLLIGLPGLRRFGRERRAQKIRTVKV